MMEQATNDFDRPVPRSGGPETISKAAWSGDQARRVELRRTAKAVRDARHSTAALIFLGPCGFLISRTSGIITKNRTPSSRKIVTNDTIAACRCTIP